MSLRWFVLMVRVIFLPVKTLFPWGSCLILSDLFFHQKKKKTTSNWNIFLIRKHRGIVHMTPSLCRDTHGLYPYEPAKQINRSESVGETFGAEALWPIYAYIIGIIIYILLLCPDPAASGRGKERGDLVSWLPLGTAVHWVSCWSTSAHLVSSSTCFPRLLKNA